MVNNLLAVRQWRILLTALTAGILLSVCGMVSQAQAAGAPAAQQADATDRGRDPEAVYGLIEQMPGSGLIGAWTIGGNNYVTVDQTEFDQEEGAFAVGVCVKLQLKPDGETVREMDSEPLSDCNRGDDDDDDDEDGRDFYGVVEAMPMSGTVGSWTISGGVYTVTEQTEIKERFGAIAVGSCVEVTLTMDESAVRELQSKRDAYCSNDDDDDDDNDGIGYGEMYAELVSFPPELIGIWQIGVISVTADANTEFQQRNGPFTVGEYVKVEFRIREDGTFLAREIKTLNTRDDDDDDNDDHGHGHGRNKAFGVIEVVPDGNIGIWQISGISYTVTISTELNDNRGQLIAGQTVKVEYRRDDAGNRIAREIKAVPERGNNPDALQKLVGYVEMMPSEGFVGNWTIGSVEFVADENSVFKERCGILAVGALVEVKYLVQDGVRRIVKVETHVPPGGGDDHHYGRIDRMDDGMVAAAGTATWEIGGRSYVVNDVTELSSDLAVGGTAAVNSYTAEDGTQVATRISSVTLTDALYIPLVNR
jgi:hypothetical protein